MTPDAPFSVLMSVYHREDPSALSAALESIRNQTLRPAEVLLVKDGPLTPALDAAIEASELPGLRIVPLERNVGLGRALAEGMRHCSYPLVARADSDDINVADRFECQYRFLQEHPELTLAGGWISEFIAEPNRPSGLRKTVSGHDRIRTYARSRNPFNHMTVMFRKDAVLAVGNYRHFSGAEDYYLWARLLLKGYRGENLPKVLVHARIGNGMIKRRSGLNYLITDWSLQARFKNMGFISFPQYLINLHTRVFPRLFPVAVLQRLYFTFLREKP